MPLSKEFFRRHRASFLIAVAAACAALAAFTRPGNQAPARPSAEVVFTDIEQSVRAAGVILPSIKVDVGAQVTAQVRKLHVRVGDRVRKGDLLVSLDPELAKSDVAQAEATVLRNESELENARIDLEQAKVDFERLRQQLEGDAASQSDFDNARLKVAKLTVSIKSLVASLDASRADLEKKRLQLGFTTIASPTDGDVVNIAVQEGQTVNAQQQTPTLLTIASLETVSVKAQVPEADIRKVKLGQAATFSVIGEVEPPFKGTVRLIQPVGERDKAGGAVVYPIMFDVPNEQRKLLPEMSGEVRIVTRRVTKVAAIPVVALTGREEDGRFRVLVASADGVSPPETRLIRAGVSDPKMVQVLDGLKPGEKVLLDATAEKPSAAR